MSQNLSATGDITWIWRTGPRAASISVRRPMTTTARRMSSGTRYRSAAVTRRRATPTAAHPPPASRLRASRFAALPPARGRVLRGMLRVEAGDRFDFYRWQEDRDRLVGALHERGYLEARVAARPAATPAPMQSSWTTTSRPAPGHDARRRGFRPAACTIAEMKTAWAEALFDDFLKETSRLVAKRALVAAGHLDGGDRDHRYAARHRDEKSVLVRMVPGPRFDDRRLDFEGNTALPSAALDGYRPRLATSTSRPGWTAAGSASTLEEHYRSLGYLAVTAWSSRRGSTARPPSSRYRIEEGPLYRVGEVSVDGAAPRPADEVRTTFGLSAGSAYRPASIEPARRKVETDYLSRGLQQGPRAHDGRPDRAQARVDLSLTIDAGPQQVLESVDVSGAGFTSKGTINRALNLPDWPAASDSATCTTHRSVSTIPASFNRSTCR